MPSITIGGRLLQVRPLNIKTLRIVLPNIEAIRVAGLSNGVKLDALIDLALPALSRGNEGVTREWLEEALEVAQVPELIAVVAAASGLQQVAPGEARSP